VWWPQGSALGIADEVVVVDVVVVVVVVELVDA
jgi:hypothetical protein